MQRVKDLSSDNAEDVQVLMSSLQSCDICTTSPNLTIELRSYNKDLMTVYGMSGSYQVKHMVKRCSGCSSGFMYGYRVLEGRIKKYDDDCLTRRLLGRHISIDHRSN